MWVKGSFIPRNFNIYQIMVIDSLMKEVFGMQLDNNFYNGIIDMFLACMDRTFGLDVKKIKTT